MKPGTTRSDRTSRMRLWPALALVMPIAATPATAALAPPEVRMAAAVDAEHERMIALLERLVNQNSGSLNLPGVEAVGLGALGTGSHAPGKTADLDAIKRQAKRAAILHRLSQERR